MSTGHSLIRILAVDDHSIFRQGIVSLLADESDMQLVAEASSGREALQQFRTHKPDITLFESGVYVANDRVLRNTDAFPEIPRLGFLHCDAYCPTRSVFFSDMEHWGVETFFTLSVLTFSFFTFSFFTFSFFTTGPANASFASRLACLASTSRRFLVFWCLRRAFSMDE